MVDENLFSGTAAPTSFAFDATGISVGPALRYTKDGVVKAIGFYATPTQSGGTFTGGLYLMATGDGGPDDTGTGTGTLVSGSSVTFGAITGGAWNWATITTPVAVTKDTVYVPAVFSSVGRYASWTGILNSDLVNGNIVGIANGSTYAGKLVRNGRYNYAGSLSYPKNHFSSEVYAVDAKFEANATGTPFTRDYASTWRVFNAFTSDYASSWRVLNAFTRDYSGSWRVFNAFTADYASSWRVLNAFTRDYSSVWRVLNSWTTDYTSSWRVLNAFTKDYASSWRVFNALTKDYADSWRVYNAFARDYASTWDVLGGTSFVRDYASTWRVFNTFSTDYSSSWRVFGPFARDYSSTWRVFNSLTRDYASTWRVFRSFTRDYTSSWVVFADTPDGLVVQVWSGNSIIAVGSVTIWDGTQEVNATIEAVTG